ncbi:DMT family transporter [Paenibacillus eucommiae]|uniref:Drug/metabolite transporter (DMT)-like permease n=1 Tax=Paenibacillus eucommiae TaxID=1355755 RepID=A0ABS4IYV6_9BACL|nr:DMT family transporter [Paenibacillus eucommiae]MBP1992230.1 drug/metabolite transporter (DMT)-like permease [Paenibacillus eucommiae]
MNRTHSVIPYLGLVIAVLAMSTSPVLVMLTTAPTSVIAAYRMLISFILLLPMLFFGKEVWREVTKLDKKQWSLCICSGFFLAAHYGLLFQSVRLTSIASVSALSAFQPLFAIIGGYLLYREKLKGKAIAGGCIAILGSCIIGWGDFQAGGTAILGDILVLLATIGITAYFLCGQHVRKEVSLTVYTSIVYFSCSMFLFGYSLMMNFSLTSFPATNWLWIVGLVLVPTLLGQTIMNWLLKWINTSTISMSMLGGPIATCLVAFLVFGTALNLRQIVGASIILPGILLFLWSSKPSSDSSSEPNTEPQKIPPNQQKSIDSHAT